MYFSILLSIFVLLSTCFILWKRRRLYYMSYKLNGPFALPGIGNLFYLIKDSHDIVGKFIQDGKKYGSLFRIWFGPKLYVYTSNPEDFEILFNNPCALNKSEVYHLFKPLVGEGLFSCSDISRWRQNRKLIARMFSQRMLNDFIPIFEKNSLILCKNLSKMVGKESFDVHSWVALCHMDIICETTTGVIINVQHAESEYVKCFERLADTIYRRFINVLLHPNFIFKKTTIGKEQKMLIDYMRTFNKSRIYSKLKQHEQSSTEKSPEKKKPVLNYLMETGQFTDDELDAEFITLMFAGIDSGSTVESFTLMLLGMHQEVQDKVFDEQQTIFGYNQREISYADLSEMKYLERVIKEAMRLFPIGGILFRTITNDIKLRTCKLPKGTTVIFGVMDAHRNPSLWKDPLKFYPDRFLSEKIDKKHPYSYIPFSAGPRDCIGQRYAMMVMKVILSTILRNYRIYCECEHVEDIKIFQHFTLKAKDGFRISLKSRN